MADVLKAGMYLVFSPCMILDGNVPPPIDRGYTVDMVMLGRQFFQLVFLKWSLVFFFF